MVACGKRLGRLGIYGIFFSFMITSLAALDGTITPIVVDTHYIFAPGEVAKGFVSFLKGFDLPTNGTVTLNLAPGMIVDGLVTGNRSTIILSSNCHLGAGSDLQGEIFVSSSSSKRLIFQGRREFTNLTLRLLGRVFLTGRGYTELLFDTTSQLDLARPSLTSCMLEDITFFFGASNSLLTSSSNVSTLFLTGCGVRGGLNAQLTFNNNDVNLDSACSLSSVPPNMIEFKGSVTLQGIPSVTLEPLSKMRVDRLRLLGANTEFVLDNSILEFTQSSTIGQNLVSPYQGQFKVFGVSMLTALVPSQLILPKAVKLVCQAGSRLIIDKRIRFTAY